MKSAVKRKRDIASLWTVVVLFGSAATASAQQAIEEITIAAPAREKRALAPAIELDRTRIAEIAAVALTDIFKTMPSIGIRTNSRGEAVLRLRGSEERQTGIFLDGAPLSVPWDGRVDLSALPAGIVEEVRVTASAAPIEYGANSVLGVVDIQTPAAPQPGLLSLQAEAGTQDSGSLNASVGAKAGGLDWLFGGGYRRVGGEAVASTSVIPYGRVQDGARVNTDLESGSLFVAAGRDFAQGAARISLLSVGAERGIANAGHIDPEVGSPRYWRYPRWHFDQMTLNAAANLGASMGLRSTLWFQQFEQTIDQYTDDSYSLLEGSEDDKDQTLGLRLVLERPHDMFDLRLIGNVQTTTHDQVDTDRTTGIRGPLQRYQQNIASIGAEVDTAVLDNFVVSTALSYDLATTPETGGRDAQEDQSDWAASVAMRWNPGDAWQITGSLGQRTRFPSLRELYGEALGEFLVNPDLRPETALLADVTMERISQDGQVRVRITPWTLHIDDTLSRRNVTIDGVRYRQRYNMNGSDGYGVEAGADWTIGDQLEVRLHGNWQDLEARVEDDGTRPELLLRPEFQSSLMVDWIFAETWDLFFEIRHLGTALDEDEDGTIVELPTSTEVNVRLFKTLHHEAAGRWRIYAGVENAGDEVVLPQLGLPQPGRTATLGVAFERL